MKRDRWLRDIWMVALSSLMVLAGMTACARVAGEVDEPAPTAVEDLVAPSHATPAQPAEWTTYRNDDYGFSFRYPSEWDLVEGQNFVSLNHGSVHLVVGYRYVDEEPNLCCPDYPPAGELVGAGTVACFGEEISKTLVRRDDRTKAVVYADGQEINVGDSRFLLYLADFDADDAAAEVRDELVDEMDGVVESLATFEAADRIAAATAVPTRVPATPEPTRVVTTRAPRGPGSRRADPPAVPNGSSAALEPAADAELPTGEAGTPVPATQPPEVEPETPEQALAVAGPRGALVRIGPGPGHDALGSLEPGERAEVTGRHINWWRIVYEGGPAWVYNETVEATNVAQVPVVDPEPEEEPRTETAEPLPTGPESEPPMPGVAIAEAQAGGANVRSGPAFRFNLKGFLPGGARVEITGRYGDWWQVTYEGKSAWVYGGVVRATEAENVPEPAVVPTLVPRLPDVVLPPAPPEAIDEERWIDVSLSKQRLWAYENGEVVRTTLISTGRAQTPTPTGQFRIWIKLRYDTMSGPGYHLPNVPYAMYFYGCYGMHGTYWHSNFGHPMSAGCVNLPTPEAAWVYDFVDIGTLVNVRP